MSDICRIIDCEHKTAPHEEPGIPSIRTPNIGKGRLILENVNRVSQRTYQEWTRRAEPQPGDLIMAREAPVGNVAIVPRNLKMCLGQRTVLIKPNRQKVSPEFLNYLLNSSGVNSYLLALSNGSTVEHLNVTDIRQLSLPRLPSLPTQQKIAGVLSAYDDLIENNKRRIAILEKMAEEIYREWFVRMRFPGYEKTKFRKGLPERWAYSPSSSVLRIMGGGTPKTDVIGYWNGEIPFFTPKDAGSGFYVLDTEKHITEDGLNKCNSALYKKNTIFMTARGTVGKIALCLCDMAMNQSCYALEPKHSEDVYFHFLAMKDSIKYIKGISKSGVFDNIIVDTFDVIPLLIPTDDLVEKFNKLMEPLFKDLHILITTDSRLIVSRDLLLSRLITGKLSVEDLDIKFPPSMRNTELAEEKEADA